jgi:short-subunit dehydrogenase
MARRQLQDRRALVTGASSGIGRALALELARQGVDLVLLARRGDRLAEVAAEVKRLGRRAETVVGDVTDPAVRLRAIQTAQEQLGGLDLLINNAGVAAHGQFLSAQVERLRPIMEVNFFAPVELIREAMPLLLEGRQPMVVNVGSILGERGCPHKSEYSASKFALHGFSEALRAELTPFGVDVLVVAAGPTATEHFDHLLEDQGELPWGDPRRASPERVARSIVRAIRSGRHQIVTSWRGWLWLTLNRFCPRLVDRILARYN